jgi:Tn3 transposase DDE domain
VAELVTVLAFQGDASSPLLAALQQYQAKDGQVTQTAPVEFLDPQEQQAVFDEAGAIRVSLYKALLFIKLTEALKGGGRNVRHSYKYRSLDDYLIAQADWKAERAAYLQRADLTGVADWPSTLQTLAVGLDAQYRQTNQRILAEENPYVHFRKDGSFHVSTPATDPEDSEPLLSVLPQRRYISLLEVLATINRCTHFLEAFTPWRVTYARAKPPERTFFAGITGYGCFIGTQKIASISSGIAASELESTVNGYFTLDNIHSANDRIIQFMDHLALPEIYRSSENELEIQDWRP